MQIHGLNKTTLLDYPGHVAATVFTGGCNFRCPFCHNAGLVLAPEKQPVLAETEVMDFLRKRRGILSGVCITGGEPTLQPDLKKFLSKVKELGYLIKLDTNGYRPGVLQELLKEELVDYVAMDIKTSLSHYEKLTGIKGIDSGVIKESIQLLLQGKTDYEFRTTVVRELHTERDFEEMADFLAGSKIHYLQAYRENENVIAGGYHPCTREEMEEYAQILRSTISKVEIRGMD